MSDLVPPSVDHPMLRDPRSSIVRRNSLIFRFYNLTKAKVHVIHVCVNECFVASQLVVEEDNAQPWPKPGIFADALTGHHQESKE